MNRIIKKEQQYPIFRFRFKQISTIYRENPRAKEGFFNSQKIKINYIETKYVDNESRKGDENLGANNYF